MADKIPLVLFIGPTAVGKTRLAIETAQLLGNAEIVSCDSRLFYRGMDIGTAKPTAREMGGIPHHLIDIANPDEVISLGVFQKMAARVIEELHAAGKLAFLVGGTGQFVKAVTDGWVVPEIKPQPALREYLNRMHQTRGLDEMNRWIKRLDPAAEDFIDPLNPRRVIRALEVMLTSGQTLSSQRKRQESPYHLVQIGLRMPRPELYQRIDDRVDQMIELGLEREVRGLLAAGYDPALPAMSAIGYPEMIDYLRGRLTLPEAVRLIKRWTHSFVRRQGAWFHENDPAIHWFDSRTIHPQELVHLIRMELGGDKSSSSEPVRR